MPAAAADAPVCGAVPVTTSRASFAKPMVAVAKKLVPSSPLRNAIRRVVREAARARPQAALPSLLVRLVALPTVDESAAATAAGTQDVAGAPVAEGRAPKAAKVAKRAKPTRPFERRLTDRALKRACRSDLDALLQLAAERFSRDAAQAATRPVP